VCAGDKKIAVQAGERGERALTYGQLLAGARSIASMLSEAGVGRGNRVGVWMEKSPATVQAILGILYAGAAYVPLDPRSPWRRCRAIAMNCGMSALIADAPTLPSLPNLLDGWSPRLVLVDGASEEGREALALQVQQVPVRTLAQAAA